MLQLLDATMHAARLQDLLQRFSQQERAMQARLLELQERLDHWQREASYRQVDSTFDATPMLTRCSELQGECDTLATELVHVRLAMRGAEDALSHTLACEHDEADELVAC